MPYFTIWQGLRGAYMPDSAYTIKADTRRELKSALAWEADSIRDAGGIGKSKTGEYVAPYKWAGMDSYPYALGVFTGANRADSVEPEQ